MVERDCGRSESAVHTSRPARSEVWAASRNDSDFLQSEAFGQFETEIPEPLSGGRSMDLYSRAIVGWSMNQRMTQQLVCDALVMALFRRGFPRGTIIHSDRGSQYCSKRYQRLINHNGLRCSMGRKANCYDNAVTESFFHTLKVELVHRERYTTRRIAKTRIFEYIETYYNRQRKHSAIDNRIPMIFEKAA
jgi:putative transposase